jgi:RNA polymerase sigma factor (sigma-70 family)
MLTSDDNELLREYALRNSEQAFATLVSRHIDMVYSAALRRTGNHHQAEEITQAVFIILARKGRSLPAATVLSGWLFRTTRLTASNYVRAEIRRSRREQEAYMQSTLDQDQSDVWRQVSPLVDDAIADLGEKDRNAIVLRFVKGENNRTVAAALGTSEQSAQVRVSRAVEKLRRIFARRGIVLSGAALTGAIAAHSVQAAPAALAPAVIASAVHGTALTASTVALVKGTLKLMNWTKLHIVVGVGVAAFVGYQYHQNTGQARQLTAARQQLEQQAQQASDQADEISKLREENRTLADARLAAAKLLAEQQQRASAAIAAAVTTPAPAAASSNVSDTNKPTSGLAAMLGNPGLRDYLQRSETAKMRTRYEPLAQSLNLAPDQSDRLAKIMGDVTMTNIEIGVAYAQGVTDRAAAHQAAAAAAADAASQLQTLLGADGYAQYQQYNREYPAQTTLKLLNAQLGDTPLTSDQGASLFQSVMAEPFRLTHGITGDPDAAQFGSPEIVDGYFQQVADSQQRLLQQAASYLTPDQLAAYGTVLSNSLTAQKAKFSALIQSR